jgi:hypothetical protein
MEESPRLRMKKEKGTHLKEEILHGVPQVNKIQ